MRAKFVYEIIQEPFSNSTRNQPISSTYPLSRLQYEDSDKPEPDADWEFEIECRNCGRPTLPSDFKQGVCKNCANKGHYADKFGTVHHENSRISSRRRKFESTK